MERAPAELVTFARRWMASGHARDVDFIARNSCTAEAAAVHTIASAPDSNLSLAGFLEHLAEFPPREIVDIDLAGWVHDDSACLCGTGRVDMLDEGFLDVRMTIVLLRQEDRWQVAHCHLSEGVPHEI